MEAFLKNFDLVPFDVVMIAVCACLFLVLWKFMNKHLFGPYMALFEAREAATIGAEDSADEARKKATSLLSEYDEKLLAARISAMEKKVAVVNAAKTEATAIIDKAEGDAQEQVRGVRWEMAKKLDEMRTRARAEVDALSDMIVSRVKSPVARKIDSTKRQ